MSEPILIAEAVHKSYRMGPADLKVLRGCSLRVEQGEFVAIMGKSGSGKSTLLHVLGALDVPQRGEVYFRGEPVVAAPSGAGRAAASVNSVLRAVLLVLLRLFAWVFVPLIGLIAAAILVLATLHVLIPSLPDIPAEWLTRLLWLAYVFPVMAGLGLLALLIQMVRLPLVDLTERRRIQMRRRNFGFVFQFYHLLPELSVLGNVLLQPMVNCPIYAWPGRRAAARQEALEILERVGLGQRLRHKPSELSGGERQRVAIARALVGRPAVLLADEPTGNLDAAAGENIMEILRQLHREGQTIVLVTHDASIARQADRVLKLENGQLAEA